MVSSYHLIVCSSDVTLIINSLSNLVILQFLVDPFALTGPELAILSAESIVEDNSMAMNSNVEKEKRI